MGSGLWHRLTLVKLPDFAYPSGRTVITVHLCVPSTFFRPADECFVDSPDYMSRFMNLRNLTSANPDPAWMSKGEASVWVDGTIATVKSPTIRFRNLAGQLTSTSWTGKTRRLSLREEHDDRCDSDQPRQRERCETWGGKQDNSPVFRLRMNGVLEP